MAEDMAQVRVQQSDPADTVENALAAALRRACGETALPYLLIDASRAPEIRFVIETLTDDALCLFDGASFDDLANVAPWLVPLTLVNDDVFDWFVAEGLGNDWGIFLVSALEPRKLKTSLKRVVRVQDEEGQTLYFKFYRPSVFNDYLPLFEPEQAVYTMRDLAQVWAEDGDEENRFRRYAIREGTLRRVDLALTVTD